MRLGVSLNANVNVCVCVGVCGGVFLWLWLWVWGLLEVAHGSLNLLKLFLLKTMLRGVLCRACSKT